MWSGPRNISTAMMRAWENRPDCHVVDEPFYACYLNASGINHPMRAEVLTSQSTHWQEVVRELTLSKTGAEIFYQKHMTHHMLPGLNLDWTNDLLHCFLIRDPVEVVNSYVQKRESVNADDIGINRQLELFVEISEITGQNIPVIDAKQVLLNPERVLRAVCENFDLEFSESMLRWPPGRRESDGVWASHWYQAVEQSTGFEPYRAKEIALSAEDLEVAEASRTSYEKLCEYLLVNA